MTHPLRQQAVRAVSDVLSNRRRGSGPGWSALGIDADFLAKACRYALTDDEAAHMRREAVLRRFDVLLAGGSRLVTIREVLDLDADFRARIARIHVEDRLAVQRCRRAFIDQGPPMRPIVVDAIRWAGVDPAALAMIAAAYDWATTVPRDHGPLTASPRRLEPILHDSAPCEMCAGIQLAKGLRLSVSRKGDLWLVVTGLPGAVGTQLIGRRLDQVVAHPALPGDAVITASVPIEEYEDDTKHPGATLLGFKHESVRTWKGESPDRFTPLR